MRAQRLRHRRPGIDEIDIDAARPVVARRLGRGDVPILARPADAPGIELANAVRRVRAQKLGQRLVAQPAAGGDGVGIMFCGLSGTSSPSATATVICAMTVAPPRPIRLRSASKTCAPRRAASIAAYMPAAPEPMTSTSVSTETGSGAPVTARWPPARRRPPRAARRIAVPSLSPWSAAPAGRGCRACRSRPPRSRSRSWSGRRVR